MAAIQVRAMAAMGFAPGRLLGFAPGRLFSVDRWRVGGPVGEIGAFLGLASQRDASSEMNPAAITKNPPAMKHTNPRT